MATGHEVESALGLSLANFDDMCDPTEPMSDFGGFDGLANSDDVKEVVVGGLDSDGGCPWADAFDTMLG